MDLSEYLTWPELMSSVLPMHPSHVLQADDNRQRVAVKYFNTVATSQLLFAPQAASGTDHNKRSNGSVLLTLLIRPAVVEHALTKYLSPMIPWQQGHGDTECIDMAPWVATLDERVLRSTSCLSCNCGSAIDTELTLEVIAAIATRHRLLRHVVISADPVASHGIARGLRTLSQALHSVAGTGLLLDGRVEVALQASMQTPWTGWRLKQLFFGFDTSLCDEDDEVLSSDETLQAPPLIPFPCAVTRISLPALDLADSDTIRTLTELPLLSDLELTDCDVPDHDLSAIAPSPSLRSVSLHGCKFGQNTATALSALPNLRSLDLSNVRTGASVFRQTIESPTLAFVALCVARTLQTFIANETQIDDDGLRAVICGNDTCGGPSSPHDDDAQVMNPTRTLGLGDTTFVSCLVDLSLFDCTLLSDTAFAVLVHCPRLRTLRVGRTGFGAIGAKSVSSCRLTYLDARFCSHFTGAALEALCYQDQLSECSNVESSVCAAQLGRGAQDPSNYSAAHAALQTLRLSYTTVSPGEAATLVFSMPSLRALEATGTEIAVPDHLREAGLQRASQDVSGSDDAYLALGTF